VVNSAVHRRVEQQAAARGDALALVDGSRVLTYRELNYRANAVARALLASGFRRGSVATVAMDRSADLAATLLGVLKAGGAYRRADWPRGLSVVTRSRGTEERNLAIDLSRMLREDVQPSPNLPILTRGSDVACVTDDGVLVPHATIAALAPHPGAGPIEWNERAGVFEIWMAWMTGAAVTCTAPPATVAA
jgi:non-ribosomal peptide synthetase component F